MALNGLTVTMFNQIRAELSKAYTGPGPDHESLESVNRAMQWDFGTTGSLADTVYSAKLSLTTGQSKALNISGGAHGGAVALTDPFGDAISFARIYGFAFDNESIENVQIEGIATDGWTTFFGTGVGTDIIKLKAGSGLQHITSDATGLVVATDEVLVVHNMGSTTIEVQMILIGRSV